MFKYLEWNLFFVDENTYIFSQFAILIVGVLVAIISAMKFINHEVLMSLIKEDVVMAKEEFERVDDAEEHSQDNLIELG